MNREELSLEGIPEELRHEGELLPPGMWSLRQLRSYREVYFKAYPEEANELPESVWEVDLSSMVRRLRLAFTDWPEVPEAATAGAGTVKEAWEACAELVEGRAAGDALAALSEFERYFSNEEEAAEQELERLQDKDAPGVGDLGERVGMARANFSMKRYAIARFRRKFAMTFEVPDLTGDDLQGTAAHRHTVAIGLILREYKDRHNNWPQTAPGEEPFDGDMGAFQRWCAEQNGIHISPSRVRTALGETTWAMTKQGGLRATLESTVEYAEKYAGDFQTQD